MIHKQITLTKGDSTYIPIGTTHGLENKTNKSLEIIEVQSGTYLGAVSYTHLTLPTNREV